LGAISCPICHEEFSLEQDYICPDCRQAYWLWYLKTIGLYQTGSLFIIDVLSVWIDLQMATFGSAKNILMNGKRNFIQGAKLIQVIRNGVNHHPDNVSSHISCPICNDKFALQQDYICPKCRKNLDSK
jgi:Zn finger protein HypA/HybF involved in hydrogenase expression